MSKAGDTIENSVTGERIVVRVGTEDSGGELLAVDGYVRPGGAVAGQHVHPAIEETFTVVSGRVGFRIDGHVDRGARPTPARAGRHGARLVERRAGGGARRGRDSPR